MAMKGKAPVAEAAAPIADIAAGISKASETKVDSGTSAAVSRLQKSAEKENGVGTSKSYTGRDFNAEARGKTRCVQFEAALMSPAIAGMKFKNIDEYLTLVAKAADYGLAYTFDELPKK